jgi:hypothetical protein
MGSDGLFGFDLVASSWRSAPKRAARAPTRSTCRSPRRHVIGHWPHAHGGLTAESRWRKGRGPTTHRLSRRCPTTQRRASHAAAQPRSTVGYAATIDGLSSRRRRDSTVASTMG